MSHLIYDSAITVVKDSTIISIDYIHNSIPQDPEPQLQLTTLFLKETLKEQKITMVIHKDHNSLLHFSYILE